MGCGANKGVKVSHPSAKNTRTATTHQTHVSDTKLESKVPKELSQPLVLEEKSDVSVDITAAPKEGRVGGIKVVEPHSAPVGSPRSASVFNVVCWCRDESTLRRIADEPTHEFTPEESGQTIVFNRLIALAHSEAEQPRISAIVYLVSDAADFEEVKAVSQRYETVWNHFVVAPEEVEVPSNLLMPHVTPADKIEKVIHDAYLDLITVIDGFLVSSKSATMLSISFSVHSDVSELLDIAGGLDTHERLRPLREHWRKGRVTLWKEGKQTRETVGKLGEWVKRGAFEAEKHVNTRNEGSDVTARFAFGVPTGNSGCSFRLKVVTNPPPAPLPSPLTSRDCYVTISLTPKPSSAQVLTNIRLNNLAQNSMAAILSQNPHLTGLFGYEIE